MNIQEKIIAFLTEKKVKSKTARELVEIFGVDKKQRKMFYSLLAKMEKDELIIKNEYGRYCVNNDENILKGEFVAHKNGFGFILIEEGNDIFISNSNTLNAMSGDIVIYDIIKEEKKDAKAEGKIIKIAERKNEQIIGTFSSSQAFGFVIPDDKRLSKDVFISKSNKNGAKDNDKVVVKIIKWPQNGKNPEGKIVDILGKSGDLNVEVDAIIKKCDYDKEFPLKCIKEANKIISNGIKKEDTINRKDLRDKLIVTIDGIDSKDLDDAISLEKINDTDFRLGVHIADVGHYVPENSILDLEAVKRGTSVYLVDRVLPMFPKEISNGICSLNPNEDRLCLSVIMDIDKNGAVISHQIVESIISNKYRLNYKEVSDYLENKEGIFKENEELSNMLIDMELLCERLFKKRKERGAIDFEFDEIYIELDNNKKVKNLKKRERRIGNRVIEEFMLLCNETVAEQFYWLELPFLYRIHENPSDEKIENFNQFVRNLGYIVKGQIHPKNFQMLLEDIKGKKESFVISTLLLRSMQKAKYTNYQDIHFGLSCKYYSHFTSPIRRYPDLQIHRIIKDFINNRMNKSQIDYYEERLGKIAENMSKAERKAQLAERECDDLFITSYMKNFIDKEFDGYVSGITNFGLFVRLENLVEGLVPISLMNGYYIYDDKNYMLKDEKTNVKYCFGDKVKIKVKNANVQTRQIDFLLLDKE